MKRILVPTNFSICAEHALQLGVLLAKQHGAELHAMHRVPMPPKWYDLTESDRLNMPELAKLVEDALVQLRELKLRLLRHDNIRVITAHTSGMLIDRIDEYTDYAHIDLIVIGSHGARGINEVMIGSNAQKVVRFANCPVLVVKEPVQSANFKQIVFASSFDEDAMPSFQRLLGITKNMDAHYHLVNIDTSSFFAQPKFLTELVMSELEDLCPPERFTTHFYPASSVEEGIRKVSEEINADLIAIANEGLRPLKRFFWHSLVEALVNHSKRPVLSINMDSKQKI